MRINHLLCFLFITVYLNGFGQTGRTTDVDISRKDSIKQLIEDFRGNDEKLIRLKNEYARLCFVNFEFENGFLSLQEAKNLSEKIDYKEGEVMYYLTLSFFNFDPENPINLYYRKKAQRASNNLEEDINENTNFPNIPDYDLDENLQEINDNLKNALGKKELSKNKEIQANILYAMARATYALGKPEIALNSLSEAIRLFSEINEIYPVFILSSIKVRTLIYLGEAEEAKAIEMQLIQAMSAEQDKNNLALIHSAMANSYRLQGRWSLAIEYYLKTLELLDPVDDLELRAIDQYHLGVSYENYGMNRRAADNYRIAIEELKKIQDNSRLYQAYGTIVFPLIAIEEYDEARDYMRLSLKDTIRNKEWTLARYNDAQGQILKAQGKYREAIPYFEKAETNFSKMEGVQWASAFMNLYLAESYFHLDDYDKALQYATESLNLGSNDQVTEKATLLLSEIHEKLDNPTQAYQFLKDYQLLRTENEKSEELNRIADAEIRSILDESEKAIDLLEREKLKKEKESSFQRWLIVIVLIVLVFVAFFTIFLYRNNKNKQKANAKLKKQKEKIELTLNQLKETQSQLIQSEKMASLGELTAGIAHEIKNPLNFVNNFSELNVELINEAFEELNKLESSEPLTEAIAILEDVRSNLQKINQHGSRADGIVKSMLQHSRGGTGKFEKVDFNALVKEYVNLAFHGMRAGKKPINVGIDLSLDEKIDKVPVIPEDFSRVILNLCNNAFDAAHEKLHSYNQNGEYSPMLKVSTFNRNDSVILEIEDNGTGISKDIINKVLQPFFTTKKGTEGTGLGLSITNDIIKAHDGELFVESETDKNTYTKFIVQLKK